MNNWEVCPVGCGISFSVVFNGFSHRGQAFGEVFRRHSGAHGDTRIERKKPWLGDGGQLGRLLHIEEYVPGPLPAVFGKIDRFRFQFCEDLLDLRSKSAASYGCIPGLNGE